jgi:hypothetical protein
MTLPRKIGTGIGVLVAVAGLALSAFALGGAGTVYGGEDDNGTPTVAAGDTTGTPSGARTGTPAAGGAEGTATPGPLTPVATPTTGAGAGGADQTPAAGGAELPETGTGTPSDGGGMTWLLMLGGAVALAGGAAVFAGMRRS